MISILFAARNSVYKTIPGLDVWDEERDALNWPGGNPGIFHPPCRLFCALKHLSTAPESEKKLSYWAVEKVRRWGGVLEHPASSTLWRDMDLPIPGCSDDYGFTFGLDQFWFGHLARKRTRLYICGPSAKDLPDIPLRFGEPKNLWSTHHNSMKRVRWSGIRDATPPAFAHWLIAVAERCNAGRMAA
jgi:hypothetical protein